ncbi:MAG: hypothetical protein HYZ44_13600 [Bacteroidetes bacterium]|nr:hypothetical protein [Bacteroidota bacterium]
MIANTSATDAGIVDKLEEYLYSSARDYYGTGKSLLDILFIDQGKNWIKS